MPDVSFLTLAADQAATASSDAAAPLLSAENAVALVTLTGMEIVLGIDNIVFIAILCGRLPPEQREKARLIGLALAMFMRIALLFTISLIMRATKYELFTIPVLDHGVTGRDLVLILGGLFLIAKATKEIHAKVEGEHDQHGAAKHASFGATIGQIILIDLVFSLDSVITAVGMAQNIWVMVTAVVISVGVMLLVSGRIAGFVDRHPTVKMLALSFLMLIGVMLVADGIGRHIPKGYIYFAMAFSLGVEMLNLFMRRKSGGMHVGPGPGAAHAVQRAE